MQSKQKILMGYCPIQLRKSKVFYIVKIEI